MSRGVQGLTDWHCVIGDFYLVRLCEDALWCCSGFGEDCCGTNSIKFRYTKGDGVEATIFGPVKATTLVSVTDNEVLSNALASPTSSSASATCNAPATGGSDNSSVIGVGVGLAVPLLLALATIAWLVAVNRRQRTNSREVEVRNGGSAEIQKYHSLSNMKDRTRRSELQTPPAEVSGERRRHEVPG